MTTNAGTFHSTPYAVQITSVMPTCAHSYETEANFALTDNSAFASPYSYTYYDS